MPPDRQQPVGNTYKTAIATYRELQTKPTNNMKTTTLISFLLLLLCSNKSFSQIITDPKQDFLSRLDPVVGDTYQKLEADFNNDGQMDVAYTAASWKNDSEVGESYGWDFYLKITGGFTRLGWKRSNGSPDLNITVDFRKDAYWLGFIPELNAYGLLSISQGFKQKGEPKAELFAILFTATTVEKVAVGSATTDIESLKKRFPKILTPPVKPVTP